MIILTTYVSHKLKSFAGCLKCVFKCFAGLEPGFSAVLFRIKLFIGNSMQISILKDSASPIRSRRQWSLIIYLQRLCSSSSKSKHWLSYQMQNVITEEDFKPCPSACLFTQSSQTVLLQPKAEECPQLASFHGMSAITEEQKDYCGCWSA